MGCVKLKDHLHLFWRERTQVGQTFAGQFDDGFDVSITGDTLIHGSRTRAYVICKANKNFGDWTPSQRLKIELPQGFAHTSGLRVSKETEKS
ncbi:Uncharacterised protein [Aeromonas encheleia]|nr:Uncharacterised protein [Aeromonas encheleia]